MKTFLFLLFSFFLVFQIQASEFIVKSFKKDPTDLAAIKDSRKDINDNQCAIIKILTDLDGLVITANLGVEGDIVNKQGQYWVYVSPGEKRLEISKTGFIPLFYTITIPIESQSVYVMVLTYQLKEEPVEANKLGFILIESNPEKADVFINGQSKGQVTPYQELLKEGEYSFTLKKELYHDYKGKFEIIGDKTITLKPQLLPSFGTLIVNSQPEKGAAITIDNRNINQVTPYTQEKIAPGKHMITLRKEMYEPISKEFTISEGKLTSLNLTLIPTFGEITIATKPSAKILIDNMEMATGSYSGRLNKGIHLIEVKKDKYYSQQKNTEVIAGEKKNYPFNLEPIKGKLAIMTTPPQADIYIDGKYYEKTPQLINDLIIGEYEIKLSIEGFADKTINATIKENQITEIKEELTNTLTIKITSKPEGASFFVNGIYKGITPFYTHLAIGTYSFKLKRDNCKDFSTSINLDGNKLEYSFQLEDSLEMGKVIVNERKYQKEKNPKPSYRKGVYYGFHLTPSIGSVYRNTYIADFGYNLGINLNIFFNNNVGIISGLSFLNLPIYWYSNSSKTGNISSIGIPVKLLLSAGNNVRFYCDPGLNIYFPISINSTNSDIFLTYPYTDLCKPVVIAIEINVGLNIKVSEKKSLNIAPFGHYTLSNYFNDYKNHGLMFGLHMGILHKFKNKAL
ncbi:PEGA domain-containing protein [Bacteroidota bacterium]